MLLDKSTAEEVANAIVAIAALGGQFTAVFPLKGRTMSVVHDAPVRHSSVIVCDGCTVETHQNVVEFVQAYGLKL